MSPMNVGSVILACCVLHNFMREESITAYCPPGFADSLGVNGEIVDGTWRLDPDNLNDRVIVNRSRTADGNDMRNRLMRYFNGPGAVPWQIEHVRKSR